MTLLKYQQPTSVEVPIVGSKNAYPVRRVLGEIMPAARIGELPRLSVTVGR